MFWYPSEAGLRVGKDHRLRLRAKTWKRVGLDFYTRAGAAGARFGRINAAIALYAYADKGRLSHDHAIGDINAARVLAHDYFEDQAS
ncbi:hypothetical protein FHS94_003872 [Sphingomonas aerophila]|jgi:hypothetical protein|uniref:Uncharacterized protein n=1 Tax=Sphingomonas aerophila TaxID=1344948 RepID=A0A7W9BHE3_9SPHN|nr:hypothetical protein [Sphingomonas aerophila]